MNIDKDLLITSSNCTRVAAHADMSGPAGRNQLLPLKFRGYATEPLDRNTVQFIHA